MNDLKDLKAARFPELPLRCESPHEPGIDETDEWRDWTALETTPDQFRIERYLSHLRLANKSILHVGIGNSGLARRFSRRAGRIVGTTITENEARHGAEQSLPNYTVELHNKYSGRALASPGPFDFIVDNNPTTFCCCLEHLMVMLRFYESSLADKGQFLTDRAGLGWVVSAPGSNPRWKFSFEDLAAVSAKVGLRAYAIDNDIMALARERPEPVRGMWLRERTRSMARRVKALLR